MRAKVGVTGSGVGRVPRIGRVSGWSTSQWLRGWTVLVVADAVLLLIAGTWCFARLQSQVDTIGSHAAPQAAVASDLYCALSDLDAQVARLITIGGAPDLASDRLDAMRAIQERNTQINLDLSRSLRAAGDGPDHVTVQGLIDGLTQYRQIALQAVGIQEQLGGTAAGRPPTATMGYYDRASLLLHTDLLPTARQLRAASQASLDDAYAARRATEVVGLLLFVVLGGGLVVLLVAEQYWLAMRFHRLLNLWLLVAAAATLVLVVTACSVIVSNRSHLDHARDTDFGPYLKLTQAEAVSYDAAGDTGRYLITDDPAALARRFNAASACISGGGDCGGGERLASGLADPDLRARWAAFTRAHTTIVTQSSAGQQEQAVKSLVGSGRGQAAFDFYYFDFGVRGTANGLRSRYDAEAAASVRRLAGWTAFPPAALGLVTLLALLAVRPRLAEYRGGHPS